MTRKSTKKMARRTIKMARRTKKIKFNGRNKNKKRNRTKKNN